MELIDFLDKAINEYPTWKLMVVSLSIGIGGVIGFLITRTFYSFIVKLFTMKPKSEDHSDKVIDLQFKNLETLINSLEELIKSKEKLDNKSNELILEKLNEIKKLAEKLHEKFDKEFHTKLDEISDKINNISWRS